jgi:hypothetical protein
MTPRRITSEPNARRPPDQANAAAAAVVVMNVRRVGNEPNSELRTGNSDGC